MLGDLKDHRLIIAKGFLFLLLGLMASVMLLLNAWDLRVVVLHLISIWAFCRFYYFAFYVIEKYVDSRFRFAGLGSFLVYLCQRPREDNRPSD